MAANANNPKLSEKLLSHFSRVSSPGRKFLPQIDGMRFVAIMWVLLFHVAGYTMAKKYGQAIDGASDNFFITFCNSGHYGVQLFFVISGFILAMPFAKYYCQKGKKLKLGAYFLRRVTRLEPPYIIHLIVMYGIVFFTTSLFDNNIKGLFISAIEHLTYANQLILQQTPPLNVVLWSLEIEVQFYILAPILTLLFNIGNKYVRRCIWSVFIIGISLLTSWGMETEKFWITNTLLGHLQYFLVGFFLLDLYLHEWEKTFNGLRYDLVSLLCFILIVYMNMSEMWSNLLLPWLVLFAYFGVFRGKVFLKFLCNPWVVTIGGMCYTIYMYHYLMISFIGKYSIRLSTGTMWLDIIIQTAIISAIALPLCAIAFALFERPFMKRGWYLDVFKFVKYRIFNFSKPEPLPASEEL